MLYRFSLDLAIPQSVYEAMSTGKKLAIRDRIRELKALAVRINEGTDREEMTIKAVWHKCHHDTGGVCEAEQEI